MDCHNVAADFSSLFLSLRDLFEAKKRVSRN
jgi:hypothetical protein